VNGILAPDAFAGKVILVTGGSRGIGRAIVLAFASLGGQVIFCYRADQNAADAVVSAAAVDSAVAAIQADVGDRAAVDRMVERVYARYGRIDVLVNNAGIFPASPVRDMSDEIWDQVLRTNLYSVFYCCRAVLPGMIDNGGGVIVNMASVAGQRGSALHAHYAAAKGGVLAFTRSLAREVSSQNIRVNAVSPGRIATDLLLDQGDEHEHARWMADTPARRLGAPEEVAAAVLYLASTAAAYVMGETLAVNGGLLMD
jgi:3-oxoacyl-[acyl-carrier protein] reductase